MSQHSSINLVKQEKFKKSFLQCDYEMIHKDQILRTSNSTVGIVFEDEGAKQKDPGTPGLKPFTHSKTELNVNLQKQFNPRTSFLQKGKPTVHERQSKPSKGSEKGENPDTVMPVDFDDDNEGKEDAYQSTPQMSFAIDYGKLRRSGYFLKYGVNYSHNKYVKVVATTNVEFSKTNQVESWLDCVPDDAPYLKDSDEDIMGEHELKSSESNLLFKYSTKEDQLKYMLLRQDDSIEYSSQPASTITHKQLESILETANMKISEYLETSHKAGHFEYEYVSGTFELPSSWKTQKQQSVQAIGPTRASVWEILKSWISSLGSFVTGGHEVHSTVDTGEGSSESQSDEGHVILEPYHGPVRVNGAMIECGTTKPMVHKGVVGSVVEEVKAALQAINVSLRKAPPKPSNPASAPLPKPQGNVEEDLEIKRLTEEVLQKRHLQKKKSRTVFGLKNTEKIPQYAVHVRRRRQMEVRNRGNGFFRAVNGWIKRKSHNNPGSDLRRQNPSNGRIIYRAPFSLGLQHAMNMNPGSVGPNDTSGTFVTFTGITTALRSFGSPLQMTPGIPASNNHDNRPDGQLENYRRRRINVRQGNSENNSIPTRYQISRGQERRGRISRNMFTAVSRL